MVRYALIILVLLSACAQVGTITGGPTDNFAPKVLSSSIQNKQLNVNANQQVLIFDEFIKVVDPQKSITLMPNDSRLQFAVKGKTLTIDFLDPLQAQTTYTLMSNGGIADITEGNDSLMTWTFSTGQYLDSMTLDADFTMPFAEKKTEKVMLAIFESDTSKNARYIGLFSENNKLQLQGLKDGAYYLKAFVDSDADGACGPKESQDQYFKMLQLSDKQNDTLHFYLTKPFSSKDSTSTLANKETARTDSTLKFGSLVLNWPNISEGAVLAIYQNEQLIRTLSLTNSLTKVTDLMPGLYSLHLFKDLNRNGNWDPIRPPEKLRSEPLYIYPEKIKVKANWDIEVPLNKTLDNLLEP
jgi:uncharacterized protein (DUF2141 family)